MASGACDLCEKKVMFGRHIRHTHGGRWERKATHKSRTFRPNINKQKVTIGGVSARINVCTRCLRTLVKSEKAA